MYQRTGRIRCLFLAFCNLHKVALNSVHFKNSANIQIFHSLNRNYYMDLNSLPYSQHFLNPVHADYYLCLFVHTKFLDGLLSATHRLLLDKLIFFQLAKNLSTFLEYKISSCVQQGTPIVSIYKAYKSNSLLYIQFLSN